MWWIIPGMMVGIVSNPRRKGSGSKEEEEEGSSSPGRRTWMPRRLRQIVSAGRELCARGGWAVIGCDGWDWRLSSRPCGSKECADTLWLILEWSKEGQQYALWDRTCLPYLDLFHHLRWPVAI